MPEDNNNTENPFKVTDRRLFTEEGELRTDLPRETPRQEPPKATETPRGSSRPPRERPREQGPAEPRHEPSIDFPSFVLSLATSVMMHLGEIPDPVAGRPVENLEAARQTIDVLNILKEKTKGNLTADEQRLMDSLLYELHLKFLTKSKVVRL